ncbi:hypothetical protein JYP51_20015 [Ponticoccus gilvus]|nr:hypothetical protein [Enemella evansiae]
MRFEKIVFFGASVTAQKTTADGVVSGYFPNLEVLLRDACGPNLEIHRFGFVGSHFDSAANMCLFEIEHLLGEKTLLVSEWHTTTLPRFDDRALRAYFKRVSETGASVLNLVLPMVSCIEKERTNIRQTRSAQGEGVWQLNLYKSDLDLGKCIRDEQHTTPFGGKAYAKYIFDALQRIFSGAGLARDEGEEISFWEGTSQYPEMAFEALEGTFLPGTRIKLEIPKSLRKREVQIFSKVAKGPETAQLYIHAGGEVHIFDTWNRYTYYRHKWSTFGPISPSLTLPPGVNTAVIEVTNNLPDYVALSRGLEKPIAYMAKMKPHTKSLSLVGGIYLLGAADFSLSLQSSE